MGTSQNRLGGAVLTTTHILCFRAKTTKKNEYPCKLVFNYIKVGWKECSLHGHVIVMHDDNMPMQYAVILTTVKTTIFR